MPLMLVEHGNDAIEFVNPSKPKKKTVSILGKSKRLTQKIWRDCPFIEKSRQVTSSGVVYICTYTDKKSFSTNEREVFDCSECPKYEMYLSRIGR